MFAEHFVYSTLELVNQLNLFGKPDNEVMIFFVFSENSYN
jgi:hypothetical protein